MEIEDWIICETLHTVTDLNDFIELHNGEWWTIIHSYNKHNKQIHRWKLLRGQHTTTVQCRFQNAFIYKEGTLHGLINKFLKYKHLSAVYFKVVGYSFTNVVKALTHI